ncbi:hypothetical protein D3C87_1268740 [compost metagenome]
MPTLESSWNGAMSAQSTMPSIAPSTKWMITATATVPTLNSEVCNTSWPITMAAIMRVVPHGWTPDTIVDQNISSTISSAPAASPDTAAAVQSGKRRT